MGGLAWCLQLTTASSWSIEAANGGTLFLDEIGDVPLPLQVKLLRLIETGTYRQVGSTEVRHSDFRLVCATHKDPSPLASHSKAASSSPDAHARKVPLVPSALPGARVARDGQAAAVCSIGLAPIRWIVPKAPRVG